MSVNSPDESRRDLGITFTVAAVARRLGVAAATLRTWDRRYGLGPSAHEAGAHRRYTADDLARLETMRRMVNAGVPAAQAAQIAGHAQNAELPTVSVDAVLEMERPVGGGDVVPLGTANSYARGLSRAAMSLDSLACQTAVSQQLRTRGAMWTWTHMVAPVLVGLGQRWETTNKGVEVEHLLSESVIASMNLHIASMEDPINSRPVVLACAPEDLHSLPLYAIAAALADQRISTRILGARVPHDALIAAMNRVGPSAVLIWAQISGTSDPTRLAGLPHQRPAARIVAGGPGWVGQMPAGVVKVDSVAAAVSELASASRI
ncbi:MAG: hypothetical protein RL441_976 [Actinomycetota bacterium]|jgi:DNA-binding transcriptional MerR regulator